MAASAGTCSISGSSATTSRTARARQVPLLLPRMRPSGHAGARDDESCLAGRRSAPRGDCRRARRQTVSSEAAVTTLILIFIFITVREIPAVSSSALIVMQPSRCRVDERRQPAERRRRRLLRPRRRLHRRDAVDRARRRRRPARPAYPDTGGAELPEVRRIAGELSTSETWAPTIGRCRAG